MRKLSLVVAFSALLPTAALAQSNSDYGPGTMVMMAIEYVNKYCPEYTVNYKVADQRIKEAGQDPDVVWNPVNVLRVQKIVKDWSSDREKHCQTFWNGMNETGSAAPGVLSKK